ncbi:hypothetical protein ACTXG6_18985 [Pseudonocardia sp. Cha107L01]|jgi:hypothetical protein|uniref:hypothetical protein n=1 Tax=Pseudonocardia sp. Cha107L01 TaxID=3457576 RepID=UPI00403E5FEC
MTAAANRWNTRLNAIKRIAETLHQADTMAAQHHSDPAAPHAGNRSRDAAQRSAPPAG